MKTCENCGERVYGLGCTWCNEDAYIAQQEGFDAEAEKERPRCHGCGSRGCDDPGCGSLDNE